MGLLLTLIAGLVIWVVLWATGTKSLDAILIPLLLVVIAAGRCGCSRRTCRAGAATRVCSRSGELHGAPFRYASAKGAGAALRALRRRH